MSNARMSQMVSLIAQAENPADGIIDAIGQKNIDSYKLFDDDVLLATYIRPERTKGGIWLTDKAKEEDRFQGKVGLLLKRGPTAWKYDRTGQYAFEGDVPEIGAWLVYRASEGWEMGLNGVSVRVIRACFARGEIPDPSIIW